ncbi:MAG: fibrobacter succinogenes major paralogous domain-containing protein [Chitinispirillia bacterium]|nr:fibrobacter succinogenes major paralogous domain-containing protein [Chitinispirillia bacterium]
MKVSVPKAAGLVAALVLSAVVMVGCGDDNPGGSGHTHSWGNWSVTTQATCNAPGLEIRYCILDNTHSQTKTTAQLTGTQCVTGCTQWSEWAQTSPATCTGPGLQTRTCIAGASDTETRNLPAQLSEAECNYTYTGRTVEIGGLTWMAENLNRATSGSWCYGEGAPVSVRNDGGGFMNITLSNAEVQANCAKYGRLYTWDAAMTACPSGWRLPDTADWNKLDTAGGGWEVAGGKLKSTSGWDDRGFGNSGNGTDDFGFSALPGGGRSPDGSFSSIAGEWGFWWSATERGSGSAWVRSMRNDNVHLNYHSNDKGFGFSARCVR